MQTPSAQASGVERLDVELHFLLDRLKKIDEVLEGPALSLVEIGKHFLVVDAKKEIPSWISVSALDDKRSLLVHSLACSTLQRLWRTHRRYPWMRKKVRGDLEALQDKISGGIEALARPVADPSKADAILTNLRDPIFGSLNPFAAAEVFWTLLHAGQNRVTGPTGFLCVFSMFWSLLAMQSPKLVQSGDARTLSASIAGKCLRPILEYQVMFRRRAWLYRQIRDACKELKELAGSASPHSRWLFAVTTDRLSGLLLEMSRVAVNQQGFEAAAAKVSDIGKAIHPKDMGSPWPQIRQELQQAISGLRQENEKNFTESIEVLKQLQSVVLPAVKADNRTLRTKLRQQGPDETDVQYAERMESAATEALNRCHEMLMIMTTAVTCCREVETASAPREHREIKRFLSTKKIARIRRESAYKPRSREEGEDEIEWSLARLAEANDAVVDVIQRAIATPVKWCRFVVRQEVAYASAGNDTEFDAADLLSAVSIAERAGSISELEVEDAISKALRALRDDGSWTAGQPIYLMRRVLGVWPNTTDIAWLLTAAVTGKPKIRRADAALMSFLDWLDRTRTHVERHLAPPDGDDETRVRLAGWSSETRESHTIDLWVTSGAINALIEMREIIEHRLWEMCERRFFVFRELDLKPLDEVDPVDLGSVHEHRLHHRLRKTARETGGPGYRKAEYSFVFHGPPGSSKTAMAEALGREMWRETVPAQRRVVRVTPADFTRQGEAGLDAEARFIFELLSHVRGVTIIFDEIDDLLSRRALKGQPAFLKMVVPAMLNRLQDLRDAAPRQEICFLVAMNYVDNVEPALTRPGRIDAAVPVVYPDPWSRDNTLDRVAAGMPLPDRVRASIVGQTKGWPWPLFNRLCETLVAEYKRATKETELLTDDKAKRDRHQMLRDEITRITLDFATQRQDAMAQYADELRWTPISPELVNEVAHFALAFGRESIECEEILEDIFKSPRNARGSATNWVPEVKALVQARLRSEWRRELRWGYNRDAAMLNRAMGATRLITHGSTIFRMWAPNADKVQVVRPPEEVVSGSSTVELEQEEPGVFSKDADVRNGNRYRYEVTFSDGGQVEVLDPYGRETDDAVQYTIFEEELKPGLPNRPITSWHDLVIYQVHPKTCSETNNYEGIIRHLDEIKWLGCNAIDLVGPGEGLTCPVVYEPRQRRREEISYGGTDGLRRLIAAAHDKQLSVIAGVTSHDFLGRPCDDLCALPYFLSDLLTASCGPQPDFESKRVVDLMFENARRWVAELGVDGLRWTYTTHLRNTVDAARNPMDRFKFLREMNERIAGLKHGTFMVAVDMTSDDGIVDREAGAKFSTQWSAGLTRAVRTVLKTDTTDLDELKRSITRLYRRSQQGEPDAFFRVVFSESHTTVRTFGRLTKIVGTADKARKRSFLAAALALVTPGIPMILQGQEVWHELPLDSDVPLDWNDDSKIRHRLRDIISLRRDDAKVTRGLQGHNVRVTIPPKERAFVIDRWYEEERYNMREGSPGNHTIVVMNFTDTGQKSFEVTFPRSGLWKLRFNSDSPVDYQDALGTWDVDQEYRVDDSRKGRVRVGPYGMIILSQDP